MRAWAFRSILPCCAKLFVSATFAARLTRTKARKPSWRSARRCGKANESGTPALLFLKGERVLNTQRICGYGATAGRSAGSLPQGRTGGGRRRSEEHTSELQ